MIDFSLTEEQLALQKVARDFAEKEIKPHAAAMDANPDPNAISPWEIMRKAARLGFTKMLRPEAYGGLGLGMRDWCLVIEEFAAADAGIATSMVLLEGNSLFIIRHGTEAQRKKFLPPLFDDDFPLSAGAFSEPNTAGSELACPIPDPRLGFKTNARKEGDVYVINGAKSAWVTNSGPETKAFLVGVRTDLSKPQAESTTLFYLPKDTPGLTVGKQTNKIGLRLADHAQIYLDDVRVTEEHRIGAEGQGMEILNSAFHLTTIGVCIVAVGLARCALEYALDYAKTRMSWGVPIIQHQAVAMMLADMSIEIEAARHMAYKAAWLVDANPTAPELPRLLASAKIHGSEMAVRVTEKAIHVLGAYGLSREYPVEKWHRDALCAPIEDVHNNLWRLQVAATL